VERFGLSHLFEDQVASPSSPVYLALAVVFGLLLFASFYVYLRSKDYFAGHRLHRRLARRYSISTASFSGLGLSSVAFAFLTTPFLSKRVWLVAGLLGLLVTAAHAGYYFRRRYPAERLAHEEWQRRQRYLPRPKATPRRRHGRRR
jgi:hypothetical protein